MNVEIIRVEQGREGTFGVLKVDGKCICLTLERPWEDNKPNVSCIPAGEYRCIRTKTKNHGMAYEVKDVPGRTSILFHPGNIVEDSQGCILTGHRFYVFDGQRGLLNSVQALIDFEISINKSESFTLTIREAL